MTDVEDEDVKLVTLLPQMHHFKVKPVRVCVCASVERAASQYILFSVAVKLTIKSKVNHGGSSFVFSSAVSHKGSIFAVLL